MQAPLEAVTKPNLSALCSFASGSQEQGWRWCDGQGRGRQVDGDLKGVGLSSLDPVGD